MSPAEQDRLDELADVLREQLVAEVGEASVGPASSPEERIRAFVLREAGVLAPETRAELARLIAQRSFGFGPLEPLLADPTVDEVMVNGTACNRP